MALVAHLRDDAVFLRGLGHRTALVDGVRQRLFAIDVLAVLHRGNCDDGVVMVGRADDDGVDPLGDLVEHCAEVAKLLRLRVVGKHPRGVAPVHVAQGDDVVAGHAADVAPAHSADADAGDVQLLAGRRLPALRHGMSRHDGDRRGSARGSEEFTTLQRSFLHRTSPLVQVGWRRMRWTKKQFISAASFQQPNPNMHSAPRSRDASRQRTRAWTLLFEPIRERQCQDSLDRPPLIG